MAKDKRGYFYRSRRIGDRVRDYFGRGPIAEAAAEVALPSQPPPIADVEPVLPPPPTLPSGPSTNFTIQLQARSEPMI